MPPDELLEPSDEEVLGYSSPDSEEEEEEGVHDDDEDEAGGFNGSVQAAPKKIRVKALSDSEDEKQEDEDIEEGWGISRQDYYNADVIETEQDALEEETEALRLQQKHLQGMTEADFGFDEVEFINSGKDNDIDGGNAAGGVVTEILPELEITESMSTEERTRILNMRYPEFEPLAKEFVELQPVYQNLVLSAKAATAMGGLPSPPADDEEQQTPIAVTKYQALTAYLGSLSMYFALFTSTTKGEDGSVKGMSATELRDHAIMGTLVECRELWNKVKGLNVPETMEQHSQNGRQSAMTENGHTERDDGHMVVDAPTPKIRMSKKERRLAKLAREQAAAQAEAEALRQERISKMNKELAELTASVSQPKKVSRPASTNALTTTDIPSDYDDSNSLLPHEAAAKAAKKKSLRFYTSQIAQKANRRSEAGRDAGGDTDIPYRERHKDRMARLNAEAERRGKKNGGRDLGGESDDEDKRVANEVKDDEDEYYDLVARSSKNKKAQKQAVFDAMAEADKAGKVFIPEPGVADGEKRAIGYTIEKNKGLAPKRKKDVRNPRVKKRKKFEEKKKKLGSVRQVYRGGEGRGGYGGEATGIKKGLIRSVKL